MEPIDEHFDINVPLAFSRRHRARQAMGRALLLCSGAVIVAIVVRRWEVAGLVVGAILVATFALPIALGVPIFGGFSGSPRHIAVPGANLRGEKRVRRLASVLAASGAGAVAGMGLGLVGGIAGAVFGGAAVFLSSADDVPSCQRCQGKHADYWENAICGDGFRWTQQDMNRDESLWLNESQATIVVGVSQSILVFEAQVIAARLFELARAENLTASCSDGERIQQRDLHKLLPAASKSPA